MSKQEAIDRTLKNSKIPKGFYLQDSVLIPGGVLGLWTDHDIKKGEYIGEYLGKILTPKQAKNVKSKYLFDVTGKVPGSSKRKSLFVLDGKNKKDSSFVRYSNAANTIGEQNAYFEQRDKRIFLRARKNIKANTEILTWYGDETKDIIAEGY